MLGNGIRDSFLLCVLCALCDLCVKSSSADPRNTHTPHGSSRHAVIPKHTNPFPAESGLLPLLQCHSSKKNSAPGNPSPASPESPGFASTPSSSSTPSPTAPAFSSSITSI